MPRKKTDNASDFSPAGRCPECLTPDPQARSKHQLSLAAAGGLDTLRSHLTEQYVKLRDTAKQRPDLVDDVCRWVAGLIEQYSNFPNPETGDLLPWWEARQMMAHAQDRIAAASYAQAPEKYRRQQTPPLVEGFTTIETPRRATAMEPTMPRPVPVAIPHAANDDEIPALVEEMWGYSPSEDPEQARARLRDQIKRLQDEDTQG
jgi:hypothetical protein